MPWLIIIGLESPTQNGLHSQQLKEVIAHANSRDRFWPFASGQGATPRLCGRHPFEALILCAPIQKICRRDWRLTLMQDRYNALRLVVRKWLEQNAIDDT